MKAIFASLLFCAALAGQPASMEGTVVSDGDGQPLSGAHVRLVSNDPREGQAGFGGMSDRTGHFSISGISAGMYILMPERTGYLVAQKPGDPAISTVHLKAGQQLTGFQIRMAARAVITGRVVDEAGDPVTGVNVYAGFSLNDGPIPAMRGALAGTTDDRGMFRLVVAPGKYYLTATPPESGTGEAPEIRTDGSVDVVYGATYYPNAASAEGAAAIEAGSGRDVTGIEIRLVHRQSLSISGSVSGPSGTSGAMVWLRSARTNRGMGAGNGHFAFNGLEPGTYQLYAQISGKSSLQSQPVSLRLDGADQNNVQLVLSPGGDVSGKLDLGGVAPAGKHSVRLEGVGQVLGGTSGMSGGDVGSDGAFDLNGVPPARYRVVVDPMPEDGYVKTVALDGVAGRGGVLDLTRGVRSARIQVSVGSDGGRLSGTVLDDSGEPTASGWGVALLIADTDGAEPELSSITGAGKYSFHGIRPGKYRVLALDLTSFAGTLENTAVKELSARGEAIEIAPNGRVEKDLKLLTKGAGDAKK